MTAARAGVDLKRFPTLDPEVRAIPSNSRLDADGKPICVWCDKRLRFRIGWGYEGEGIFCRMKCAADWGNAKASALSDD